MGEVVSWTVVVGLAVTIAAISMLYIQVEQEVRSAFEAILQRIIVRLEARRTNQPQEPSRQATGERVSPRAQARGRTRRPERRALPRRRLDDLFPSQKLRRIGA